MMSKLQCFVFGGRCCGFQGSFSVASWISKWECRRCMRQAGGGVSDYCFTAKETWVNVSGGSLQRTPWVVLQGAGWGPNLPPVSSVISWDRVEVERVPSGWAPSGAASPVAPWMEWGTVRSGQDRPGDIGAFPTVSWLLIKDTESSLSSGVNTLHQDVTSFFFF